MTPEEKLQLMDVESSVSSEMLFKFGECTEKLHPKMEICAILILERLESKINPDKRCRAVFYSRHDSVYLHYNPNLNCECRY